MKNIFLPRKTAQTALRGFFYFCLAALPALALAQAGLRPVGGPALIRELFMPGIRSEIWTVKGETIWLDGIRLTTPADFDALPAGEPIARFSADTTLPGGDQFFGRIQKMVLGEMSTAFLPSDPQQLEYYRLGDVRNAVPPPPDWRHAIGQIPPWHRAEAVPDLKDLPFLNHAVFCWNGRAGSSAPDMGIYLFRQAFRLEQPETIARVTLRLASNVDVIEAYFNEHPLHLFGSQKPALAEFEVTPLLRGGNNIVALKVRGHSGAATTHYGLAFHLEVVRQKAPAKPEQKPAPDAALALGRRGDRVWGTVTDLSDERILMSTAYGSYAMGWDDCAGLLFPGGWQLPKARRPIQGLRQRLFPAAATPEPDNLSLNGLPLAMVPDRLQNCLLLTEGRVTTAKPSHLTGDQLYFEGTEGRSVAMPMRDVLGIFPPLPAKETFRRPPRAVGALFCRVSTRTGEAINGLLRQISPASVVVESEGGHMMKIKPDQTASIEFPYHSAILSAEEARKGPIMILAQTGGESDTTGTQAGAPDKSAPDKSAFERDMRAVEGASFAIGADCKPLAADEEANPTTLRPDRIPVLVSLDHGGAYLHSWFGDGDAQTALEQWISNGGVLVVLAHGGALNAPVANQGSGNLKPVQARPALDELLGLHTVRAADSAAAGLIPFDQPANDGGELFFERATQAPEGFGGLPRRVELSPIVSPSFAPVVAHGEESAVIYNLSGPHDKIYGPGLTITPHRRGWVMVIDRLLWESRVDDRPFTQQVLPSLLRWAMVKAAH